LLQAERECLFPIFTDLKVFVITLPGNIGVVIGFIFVKLEDGCLGQARGKII